MLLLHLLASVLALAVLVPSAILALECLAACLPAGRRARAAGRWPRTVVLVPAHDEEDCLPAALRSIRPELEAADRVLVVAHNCTDGTAAVARAHGALVCEARDDGARGKPAALEAGLAFLDADPPEVVVIVDADCSVEFGAIDALARAAHASGGPVQGAYLFDAASEGGLASLSSLALLVKNVVRPSGLARLGLPCLLNGAGSAYPFELLRRAPHGRGSIAEDYQLSIDLALLGHPTRFVREARVTSSLPARRAAAYRQRKRWEHGHLALAFGTAPRLIRLGLVRRAPALAALGLDLLVPPLAFLVLAWLAASAAALASFASGGGPFALVLVAASAGLSFASIAGSLWRFAGARTALAALARIPLYVGWKLPLYLACLGRRETRWRKTERV